VGVQSSQRPGSAGHRAEVASHQNCCDTNRRSLPDAEKLDVPYSVLASGSSAATFELLSWTLLPKTRVTATHTFLDRPAAPVPN
jgi:hypothetical protein